MFKLPVEKFRELMPIPNEYYFENRARVIATLKKNLGDQLKPASFILMRGHEWHSIRHDDDASFEPTSEPNFLFLFGLPITWDLHGLIDIDSGKVSLVIKDLDEVDKIFHGGIMKDSCAKKLNCDEIITVNELEQLLKDKCKGDVFLLHGKLRDNLAKHANFDWLKDLSQEKNALYAALCEVRTTKSKIEQDIMREVVQITCEGHKYMMKEVKDGMGEHQLAELFKLRCGLAGSQKLAYETIVGVGRNASILHYIVNNGVCKDGELILCDVGIEGNGYCADVTSTFPINGKFDEKQKQIYNACLRAQRESMAMVKPGVKFVDVQRRSFEIICEDLLAIGIYKDATVKELMEKKLFGMMMPHSLGHYLGLFTHDVGCCIHSDKDNCTVSTPITSPTLVLQEGMVITVEPGIYFIRSIIDDTKKNPEKAPYVDFDKVEEYFYVGGVRIEDDVLVTADGFENLSPLPRTVEEIEAFMAGTN
jgi:Xaa-Pro dipeptidase